MTGASVGRLWHYPVKSMRGEEVREILLGPAGVVGDRAYGFLNVQTGRVASAKRPKRYGALLECQARFVSPPRADAPTPPIEVTFPDGRVVRDDEAELTRRVTALLGREVRMVTSAPVGAALEEVWTTLDGFGPEAVWPHFTWWRQVRSAGWRPNTPTVIGIRGARICSSRTVTGPAMRTNGWAATCTSARRRSCTLSHRHHGV